MTIVASSTANAAIRPKPVTSVAVNAASVSSIWGSETRAPSRAADFLRRRRRHRAAEITPARGSHGRRRAPSPSARDFAPRRGDPPDRMTADDTRSEPKEPRGGGGADRVAGISSDVSDGALRDLLARLESEGEARGFPAGAAATLLRAVEAVLAASAQVNLTGAKTLAAAVEILALDAMPVGSAWPADRPPPRVAVDLGTGNGFPGVAVAVRWPACRVVLVERREKKAKAVEA